MTDPFSIEIAGYLVLSWITGYGFGQLFLMIKKAIKETLS